jgi:thioredoxin reductase (NADPH)
MRVLIRGDDLYKRMSRYLIDRIGSLPNVTLCPRCALTAIDGDAAGLTHVRVQRLNDDEAAEEIIATRHLFLFIGADPETGWLGMSGVELDARGFIKTHFDRGAREASERFALETSVPGMFAVGDVRSESAKRVASAVGDGAAVVSQIHAYLNCMVEHDAPARLRHG